MKKRSVLLFLLLSAFLIAGLTSCEPENVIYRVTFDANREEFFNEAQASYFSQGITVFRDSKIVIPETVNKADQAIYNLGKTKIVDSWLCKESNKVWDFSTKVKDNITLIAQWKSVV